MNGRSARLFLDHGLEQTNYQADYSAVGAGRWAVASAQSIHPGLNRPAEGPLDYTVLRELFKEVIVDRPQTADENTAESTQNAALNAPWAATHPPAPTHRAPMHPVLARAPASRAPRPSHHGESARAAPTWPTSSQALPVINDTDGTTLRWGN
jgi:hypothetical protein